MDLMRFRVLSWIEYVSGTEITAYMRMQRHTGRPLLEPEVYRTQSFVFVRRPWNFRIISHASETENSMELERSSRWLVVSRCVSVNTIGIVFSYRAGVVNDHWTQQSWKKEEKYESPYPWVQKD